MSSTSAAPPLWQPRHWRSAEDESPGFGSAVTGDQNDAESSASIDAINAALQRPGWRLLFPAALEHAYHRDTGVTRVNRIVACNVIAALMTLANTVRDASTLPTIDHVLSPLRWGTAAFIVITAALMFWRRRTLAAWVPEVVTTFGSSLIALYVLIAASSPIEDLSALIKMGGISLLFMHAGLAARQQFRYALCQGLLMLLGYTLLARSDGDVQAIVVSGNILLLSTTLAFSLMANYVLEFRERRAYLLRTLEIHQRRQLAQATHSLRWLSLSDGLTGLANRRHFEAELRLAWRAAKPDAPLGILQLDVDHFKRYNDHYGHPAGDVCLRRVADALHELAARHGGFAARTGGEEFALLLPACTPGAAAAAGEDLRLAVRALALPHADSAVAPIVTVSIGTASGSPATAAEPAELVHAADEALYAAKGAGRDRVMSAVLDGSSTSARRPLAAEAEPITDAADASAALVSRIDALSAELDTRRLRWLKFAPALERAFVRAHDRHRAVLLSTSGVLGALFCLFYNWMSQPLFADVAAHALPWLVLITAAAVLVTGSLWLRMAAGLREALFAATAVGVAVGAVILVAPSQQITIHSYSLSFFLIPTFVAVVAAQPFRLSLLVSMLIWGAVVIGLRPEGASASPVWIESSLLVFDGIALSLVGGYLLEFGTRRNHLLKQLAAAQSELLGHHTERLRGLAATDPLTGLANRRSFDARHAALWASCAAECRPLALLIVDVDHFKRYNDGQGHPAGDQCLKRIAHALAASGALDETPASAPWVARLGGEEFGVLLPGHDLAAARAFGHSLCLRVSALGIAHPDSPTAAWVTVSIGAASMRPSPGSAAGPLLHGADAALYQAKDQGRNRAEAALAARSPPAAAPPLSRLKPRA